MTKSRWLGRLTCDKGPLVSAYIQFFQETAPTTEDLRREFLACGILESILNCSELRAWELQNEAPMSR